MASVPVYEPLSYSFFMLSRDLDTVFEREPAFQDDMITGVASANDPAWKARCQDRRQLSKSVHRHAERIAVYGQKREHDVIPLIHLMRILRLETPSDEWNGSFKTTVCDAFELIFLEYRHENPEDGTPGSGQTDEVKESQPHFAFRQFRGALGMCPVEQA